MAVSWAHLWQKRMWESAWPSHVSFIRAPLIENVSEGVEVLSRHEGEITAVRWKSQLAMTFHPELTEDRRLHEMFLSIIEERGI